MKTRRLVVELLSGAVLVSSAGIAEAVCSVSGKVQQISSSATAGSFAQVIIAPHTSFPTFYFSFTTNSERLIGLLGDAEAASHVVTVVGNAAACPTAGTFRFGGTLTNVTVNQSL